MKLLLHMCCGPCSCYPVKKLRADGIEPVGWFFNPNIHPYTEWDHRLKTAKEFAEKVGLEIITEENYQLREFLGRALTAEKEAGGRCKMCYTWRLGAAAKYAAENGYEAFTSTLFYSIYQQHELMKETAEYFAEKLCCVFLAFALRVVQSNIYFVSGSVHSYPSFGLGMY